MKVECGNYMVYGADYEYVQDYEIDGDFAVIRLLDNGLVYHYMTVSFGDPEQNGGEMLIHFDYMILENPNNITIGKEEYQMMGDVIVSIIQDNLEESEDGTGQDYSEEFAARQ